MFGEMRAYFPTENRKKSCTESQIKLTSVSPFHCFYKPITLQQEIQIPFNHDFSVKINDDTS